MVLRCVINHINHTVLCLLSASELLKLENNTAFGKSPASYFEGNKNKKEKKCFMCWICQEFDHKYFIYITKFKHSLYDSINCTGKIGSLGQPLSNVFWKVSADFIDRVVSACVLTHWKAKKFCLKRQVLEICRVLYSS